MFNMFHGINKKDVEYEGCFLFTSHTVEKEHTAVSHIHRRVNEKTCSLAVRLGMKPVEPIRKKKLPFLPL